MIPRFLPRRIAAFLVPVVVVAVLRAEPVPAPVADPLAGDEATLKEASVGTDGAALLDYFRSRTLGEEQRARVARLIAQLGADDYQAREDATDALIKIGAAAAPALVQAAGNPDPEVSSRAKRGLAGPGARANPELYGAAARLLADRKPAGAVEVLLAYLPCAFDEGVEEEVVAALGRLGVTDGKPSAALIEAAGDPLLVRRLAAATALARAAGPDARSASRKLLADKEPRVRLAAAIALATAEDREAVPVLVALLLDAPPALAWQAEDFLLALAGGQSPAPPLDPADKASRARVRDAWQTWWRENGEKVDLALLAKTERRLGLTLVAEFDGADGGQGRVWEYGPDGKARWKIAGLNGPTDASILPGGRILLAEHTANRVTERARDGSILWEYTVENNPVSCQRLPNGNTFIATYTELLEVTRENKVVWTRGYDASIYCARRLANGNTLFVHSGNKMIEIDAAGKEVRRVDLGNTSQWAGVEVLANGHFLIALYSDNKVVEIDADGKVFLTLPVPQATYATRLPNGHTLAADTLNKKVIEFDRQGKKVKEQTAEGKPFRVRRR
jgi:HEAT repeat protein